MKADVTARRNTMGGIFSDAFMVFLCIVSVFLFYFNLVPINSGSMFAGVVTAGAVFLPTKHRYGYSPLKVLLITFYVFLIAGIVVNDYFRPRLSFETQQLSLLAFFSLAIGLYLASVIIPIGNKVTDQPIDQCKTKLFLRLLVVIGMTVFSYLIATKGIPIFSSSPNYARLEFFRGSGHLAFFFHALSAVSLALLFDAVARFNARAIAMSHAFALIVFVCNSLIGGRGVVLANLISYFLVYALLKRKSVNTLYMVFAAAMGILFMTGVGSLRRFGHISVNTMFFELSVILTARPEALDWIVLRFPSEELYGWTRYFSDALRLLPWISGAQNSELKDILLGDQHSMPDGAEINPGLIGEAYINMGKSGVLYVPLILGMLCFWLYAKAKKHSGSFFWISAYAIMFAYTLIGLSSGLGTRVPRLIILIGWVAVIDYAFKYRFVFKSSR